MYDLAWIIIAILAFGLPIPLGVLVLAISPAKGQTIKRMLRVFITTAPATFVVGMLATTLLHSHVMARLTGMFFISVGLLAGGFAGLHQALWLRKQGSEFPSIAILK
jgi:hypothetical protein